MKTNTAKKPLWKRIVLISSVVVLVAAPTLYAWTSVQAWNTASTTTANASSSLKESVDNTLASETAPESTQIALNEIIKNYSDALVKGPCELPSLYEWQHTLPWLKDTRQKCIDTAKSSDELASTLKNLQTLLKEQVSAAQLVKQANDATLETTDYAVASATWLKVADDSSLVTTDSFAPVGANIKEVSTAIATAYTALDTANKSQDKGSFDTAKKGLSDAYTRLSEIKTVASEALAGEVDAVINAYENA